MIDLSPEKNREGRVEGRGAFFCRGRDQADTG